MSSSQPLPDSEPRRPILSPPPRIAPLLPTPDRSVDCTPHPDTFEEFMQLGDASPRPQPGPRPPPPIYPPSHPATSPQPQPQREPQPQPQPQPQPEPQPQPQPQPQPHPPARPRPSSPPNALSFFSGLFTRATNTIGTTLQTTQSNLSHLSTDVLPQAQQNLSSVSSSALSTVSNLVSELTPARNPTSNTPLKPIHCPPSALLHCLLPSTPRTLLIVTPTHLHTFSWASTRLTSHPFNITWSSDRTHALSTPLPPSGSSLFRPHNPGNPVLALLALYLPSPHHLLVAHEDAALRVYNLSSDRFGVVMRTGSREDSAPTVLSLIPSDPSRVVVGYADGDLRIVALPDLTVLTVISPSEFCVGGFGKGVGYAAVSCVTAAKCEWNEGKVAIWGGFQDGGVVTNGADGNEIGRGYVTQGRRVGGMVTFFDGVVVLTIGNDMDPSLGLFDAITGTCFVRRMLPYVPSHVVRVERAVNGLGLKTAVCPSEFAFVVGGEEGQVEVFRVVVLSSRKLEVRLVRRVSERMRGRDRAIVSISYIVEAQVLVALSKSGELRRWHMTALDASSLAMRAREGERRCTYTEENIVELISQEFVADESARMSSVGGLIEAQNALACILDAEGIPEANKDHLVAEFQKQQTNMQTKTSQADTELRRAGRRICGRFSEGIKPLPEKSLLVERRLSRAAKRTAAFEMEFAARRHAESLKNIQEEALVELKSILSNCLKGVAPGDVPDVHFLRRQAERLGSS